MRPNGAKQIGDYMVTRHREADKVTGQVKVVGSRISGPAGVFKVPQWPNRISDVSEANGQIFVGVKDEGSRPYVTTDRDRLTESQVALSESLEPRGGRMPIARNEIGQLRYLVHSFQGTTTEAAKRFVEAGLNEGTADRLAAWVEHQSKAMGMWRGVDSSMRESDAVVLQRSLSRAPLRLTRDVPQLPQGFLEGYVSGMLGDERVYTFASGQQLEVVRGEDPFVRMYEMDARRNSASLADTEAALREAVRRQDDCRPLVARWLSLHGDDRALREADQHLVHIVAERVVTGSGPARGRSSLDQRVIAAQMLGAAQVVEAQKVESEGTVQIGANNMPGAGEPRRTTPNFREGVDTATTLDGRRSQLKPGDIAPCGHKIAEGGRTVCGCGEPYMRESPWTAPEQVVRQLASVGPWSATVDRARRDLGYQLSESASGFTLAADGLPSIIVATEGEQITEARIVESAARHGWKPEAEEHDRAVSHHTERWQHHDQRRRHFSALANEATGHGDHAAAREWHDRAAHHRRAAEHHSRQASAARDLHEDDMSLPESPIDAGEADTSWSSLMQPKDASGDASLAEAWSPAARAAALLSRERNAHSGAMASVQMPTKSAPFKDKVKAAQQIASTMRSGQDILNTPRVPFTKAETHGMVRDVAEAYSRIAHGQEKRRDWDTINKRLSILEHAPDEHFQSLGKRAGMHLAGASEMANYHSFGERIPKRHWDDLQNTDFGEADLAEAKHHDSCPQCGMGLEDPMARKCPRCGESLQLSASDRKADSIMARGHGSTTSTRIKQNMHHPAGRFAESIVDEVLGEAGLLEARHGRHERFDPHDVQLTPNPRPKQGGRGFGAWADFHAGTSYHGDQIPKSAAGVAKLKRHFGEGNGPSHDGKTSNEWTFELNHRGQKHPVTLYDYKGGDGWHIGANSPNVSGMAHTEMANQLGVALPQSSNMDVAEADFAEAYFVHHTVMRGPGRGSVRVATQHDDWVAAQRHARALHARGARKIHIAPKMDAGAQLVHLNVGEPMEPARASALAPGRRRRSPGRNAAAAAARRGARRSRALEAAFDAAREAL